MGRDLPDGVAVVRFPYERHRTIPQACSRLGKHPGLQLVARDAVLSPAFPNTALVLQHDTIQMVAVADALNRESMNKRMSRRVRKRRMLIISVLRIP